jgi:hypothetical protein
MSTDDSELVSVDDTTSEQPGTEMAEKLDEQQFADGQVGEQMDERGILKARLGANTARHDRAIAIGLPFLLLLVFLEVLLWSTALWEGSPLVTKLFEDPLLGNALRVSLLLVIATTLSVYYLRYRTPLARARQALEDYDDQVLHERISTQSEWRRYLQEEVRRLTNEISRVFLDNSRRFSQAKRLLKQADENIKDRSAGSLVEAQAQISSIKKLILAEEDELRGQLKWRLFAVGVAIAYAAALAVFDIASRSRDTGYNEFDAPDVTLFGVPALVLAWGAIGSLAAILYRFYKEEQRVEFDTEVRWLIARPIVGIIMGAVSYLAVASGMLIFTSRELGNMVEINKTGLWIVAFLAGFSDKFYIGIINLLVHRTVGNHGQTVDA